MRTTPPRLPCIVETLEDRQLMAVTSQLLDGGATLRLVGDAAHESVTIVQNDAEDTLRVQVTITGAPNADLPLPIRTYSSSAIKRIVVNLGAGTDTLTYQLDSDEMLYQKTLAVDLGTGNDTALFDFGGRLLYDSILPITHDDQTFPIDVYQPEPAELRAKIDINVMGAAGHDSIDAIFGNVRANLNYRAMGGAGNDSLNGSIAGMITQGNSALIDQDGGLGNDALSAWLDLNGMEAGSKLTVNQRGGTEQDTLNFLTFGGIQGALQVNQWGGAGNDILQNTVLAQWSSIGRVQLRQYGDAGNDELHASVKRADLPPNVQLIAPLPAFRVDAVSQGGTGRNFAWLTPNVRSLFNVVKERSWDTGFPIPVDAWPF